MTNKPITPNIKPPSKVKSELKRFAEIVYEPDDIVELRLLGKDKAPVKYWIQATELPGMFSKLADHNHDGYNIYAGPNPRKDFKLSGDDSVLLARCVFCDFDKIETNDGCGMWEVVSDRIYQAGIDTPDLVIFSGHGIHTYWRLTQPTADLERWRKLQDKLAVKLDSDRAIKNPERIMRLPGFMNVKQEPKTDCFIIF